MSTESQRTFHGVPITDKLKIGTPSEREIAMTRVFDAPRQLVFDAFTQPALVKRWLYGWDDWSLEVCDLDVRPGGALRYVWRGPQGQQMGMGGVYREIVPPERFVHTELFDEDWTGGETLVTTEFEERDGRTTVTMTVRYASRQARDDALQTGMEHGLAVGYDRLEALLASGAIGNLGRST
jgi:uncharacterized protein YndB with AHSA1/START domain